MNDRDDSDVDRFHFDVSSFPPAVARQQVSLEVDNKPLKFILPLKLKYSSVTRACINKNFIAFVIHVKIFSENKIFVGFITHKVLSNKIFPDYGMYVWKVWQIYQEYLINSESTNKTFLLLNDWPCPFI